MFIGFGKCSKYLIFILGAVIFKTINNFIFENQINPESEGGIFGFVPVLSNHVYIQYLYRYISYIIGGLIFEYFLLKMTRKDSSEAIVKKPKVKINPKESVLIFNDQRGYSMGKIIEIFIVSLSYCISYEIVGILYLFKFDRIEIWTLEILFVFYFMKKYFVINLYNYTKLALFIILVPTTILLITSTFLPYTNHVLPDEKKEDLDAYEEIKEITGHKLYFIPIFIAFITLTIFLSYSRVKSKVLMDLRYISTYLIILFEGVIGTILIFIMIIIFSTNKCSDTIADFCYVADLENEEKVYIDNAKIYFQSLKRSGNQMYILFN